MDFDDRVFEVADVRLWLESDSSVMLKAVTAQGDPAELEAEEARKLANILAQMADYLAAQLK